MMPPIGTSTDDSPHRPHQDCRVRAIRPPPRSATLVDVSRLTGSEKQPNGNPFPCHGPVLCSSEGTPRLAGRPLWLPPRAGVTPLLIQVEKRIMSPYVDPVSGRESGACFKREHEGPATITNWTGTSSVQSGGTEPLVIRTEGIRRWRKVDSTEDSEQQLQDHWYRRVR